MKRIIIFGGLLGLFLGGYMMMTAPEQTSGTDLVFIGMGAAFPVWILIATVWLLGLVFGPGPETSPGDDDNPESKS